MISQATVVYFGGVQMWVKTPYTPPKMTCFPNAPRLFRPHEGSVDLVILLAGSFNRKLRGNHPGLPLSRSVEGEPRGGLQLRKKDAMPCMVMWVDRRKLPLFGGRCDFWVLSFDLNLVPNLLQICS